MALLWVVVLVHVFKYPFFEFGPRYAAATGENLLNGYRRLGLWVVVIFLVLTMLTMFTVQAAVTAVTAALMMYWTGFGSLFTWSIALLLGCGVVLYSGRYKLLDRLMKVLVVGLSIATLVAVFVALRKADLSAMNWAPQLFISGTGLTFLIALMGWMPAPLDLSVWHSIWAVEKRRSDDQGFDYRTAMYDFRIGYGGTVVLALAFLALGAAVLYGTQVDMSVDGGDFAKQLMGLYTQSLGEQTGIVIGIAALMTMLSTTLTCLDALPRVMTHTVDVMRGSRYRSSGTVSRGGAIYMFRTNYLLWMAIVIVGALMLLSTLSDSLRAMVTLATVLSFVTTPFFAAANFVLVRSRHTPEAARPGIGMQLWSVAGLVFLVGFAVLYLIESFG